VHPRIYSSQDHLIDPAHLDPDALQIVARLRNAGYEAYIVGGSVRDLLAQKTPKDFDISTSALPEEIKKVFQRQCIIIGRRFRLAHIRYGHKIFEVATFRRGENEDDLITHDNEWGTAAEDVARRDFTINGLFYDSSNHTIIDYVGGVEDVKKKLIRCIGDPPTRFKQDPVRMIRLLKFRARTGFEIDEKAREALLQCREEIAKSSSARLLEELLRMLESGAASPFLMLMAESRLLELLVPPLAHFVFSNHGQELFKYVSMADRINQNSPKQPIDRSILLACLLYPILEVELNHQYIAQQRTPHIGDVMTLTSHVIHAVLNESFSHFPRRLSTTAAFILTTQYRLTPFSGRRHPRPKMIRMKEFDLALKFLKIRALVNPEHMDAYQFWKNLYRQHAPSRGGHSHGHGHGKHHRAKHG